MPPIVKPRALRPGDLVALVAPAGGAREPAQVDRAAAMLEGLGFRVRIGAHCREARGYLAGSDRGRAADLDAAFADPEVAGIVCLKGGYGTPRILDLLDYGLARRNPKVLAGYSDITGLHLAYGKLAGLATFHAPMGISDVLLEGEPFSTEAWRRALYEPLPLGRLPVPPGREPPRILVPGRARGPLAGGNLSLVAALMGTPYELDLRGKILFFEDIGERPYRVDRMLTQLRLSGKLAECAGIVLGDWKDCGPEAGKPSLALEEVFAEILAPLEKPVLMNLGAGHCAPSLTLPFGAEALLEAEGSEPGLSIEEAATTG